MSNNIIITISRECGSGGGEIARMLGKELGIKVYGRALMEEIAKQFDLNIEEMDRVKAQKTNWWDDFCRFYQQFGAAGHTTGSHVEATPMSLYYAEAKMLRDFAEKESCIIVGRVGFHIFRDYPNAIHLFITADRDARIARIATKQNLSAEEAAKLIDRIDKERDTFVKSVADTSRYDVRNYNVAFNVSMLAPENVAAFLADNIRKKMLSGF